MRQTVPFRRRLFAAFLIVSLIPLLICSAMLLQIFRLRLVREAQREMEEQLEIIRDGACQRGKCPWKEHRRKQV